MQQIDENFTEQNAKTFNLIPQKDVALIKIKLGKTRRKESDWAIIKNILSAHNIIVAEPVKRDHRLSVKGHILCKDEALCVFTNFEDCREYIINLNHRDCALGRLFQLGSMPFEQAVDIADQYGMDLHIDFQDKANAKFMCYVPGEKILKAVIMNRRITR